ncbi:MAG: response regulator [Candidatus Omnitrophica bacterium]|nr:response regulator [Candidatus Omnitrophota bacterium]
MDKSEIRIMVLDDEEGIVFFVKNLLIRKGYGQVFATTNPMEALEHYRKEKSDICILDVFLGSAHEIDGLKVLAEVKKINPQAVCLMVSRMEEEAIVEKAKDLGAEKYCFKPIELKNFIETLNSCVDKVLTLKRAV